MSDLAKKVLEWYLLQERRLPWGKNPDPYSVWISEVMLQQTQMKTVIPYYHRWIHLFPTIFDLYNASEEEVLSAWEGMGYYKRALNIIKTAKIIVDDHGGNVPDEYSILKKLPGIGPYIAGAIASIAYNKDVAILDSNIKRIYSRIYNVEQNINEKNGERILQDLAKENLPVKHAGDYNQALMNLGETICLPKHPLCRQCPIGGLCISKRLGVQEKRPIKKTKPRIPHYFVTAAVIKKGGKVLIAKRPPGGLLAGLWEFPGGKQEKSETLEECVIREIKEELSASIKVDRQLGIFKHAYTHFRVTLYAYRCSLVSGNKLGKNTDAVIAWVRPAELGSYPMGKIDRLISNMLGGKNG
jgi:A/G-specific adenine glycosylase